MAIMVLAEFLLILHPELVTKEDYFPPLSFKTFHLHLKNSERKCHKGSKTPPSEELQGHAVIWTFALSGL